MEKYRTNSYKLGPVNPQVVGSSPTGGAKKKTTQSGGFFIGCLIPILLLDLKGGTWRQSGGLSQQPWLFRRKASPTGGAKKPPFSLRKRWFF